jgi:antitoxin component YwqK of YwqJK toxin-antitoxin module
MKKNYEDNKFIFLGEYYDGLNWLGNVKIYNKFKELIFESVYLYGMIIGNLKECDYGGKLEFEGEYLNGKRNGKGKGRQYKNYIDLFFAGEYLNDVEWNGKVYDLDYNIIYELKNGKKIDYYEVEYLNGIRKIGKEYCESGMIIFEGEYLNGIRWNGKEYNERKKLLFEGEYLNGIRWNGKEKDYDKNGDLILEVEIINGKGRGKEYHFNELIYEGEFLNGKRNGNGKEYEFKGSLKFEGKYLYGKKMEWKNI